MSKQRITLRGKAARAYVAALLIGSKGAKAAEGTTGPMKAEIEKQTKDTPCETGSDSSPSPTA